MAGIQQDLSNLRVTQPPLEYPQPLDILRLFS